MRTILQFTVGTLLLAGGFMWELLRVLALGNKAQIDAAEDYA